MFNLIPFARAGRKVADRYRHGDLIREVLKFDFPQPKPVAVTSATIRADQ